jgi:hypothetical protein
MTSNVNLDHLISEDCGNRSAPNQHRWIALELKGVVYDSRLGGSMILGGKVAEYFSKERRPKKPRHLKVRKIIRYKLQVIFDFEAMVHLQI